MTVGALGIRNIVMSASNENCPQRKAEFKIPGTGPIKFSVIIPTFNRGRYLGQAIDSVLQQCHSAFEVIVIDDGSVDHTQTVAESYADQIIYLQQGNCGVSAARNRGIRAAKGEWITFLDSDDEWLPNYLGKHAELLERYPSIVGSVMNSVAEAADGQTFDRFEEQNLYILLEGKGNILVPRPFRIVTNHHITTLQSCAFRRDVLLSTRLFDEGISIAEDWDVVAQMALKGSFVVCAEIHSRVIRRQEDLVNLSAQITQQGIRTRLAWARVFSRFLQEFLSDEEHQALRRKYSANQRALGNLYLCVRAIHDARKMYQQAWKLDHSLASLGRLMLSYLPKGVTLFFFALSKDTLVDLFEEN